MTVINGQLLKLEGLTKYFPVTRGFFKRTVGHVKAVEHVSFGVNKGEIVGLVGESGCGKTTLGRLILNLIPATSGKVLFKGEDVFGYDPAQLFDFRSRAQIIFQDPYSSLNPRMMINDMLREVLDAHSIKNKSEVNDRIVENLTQVGLGEDARYKYPHEFSGGQRQRLAIARALILEPEFIVCDEPVSALDVSIQSQILNLLLELKEKRNLTYLFISHDLSVVHYISDRLFVMYLGQVIEEGDCKTIMTSPKHPYTISLLGAVPRVGENIDKSKLLKGDPPSPVNVPPGCRFHTRCPIVMDRCKVEKPEWVSVSDDHKARCFAASNEPSK